MALPIKRIARTLAERQSCFFFDGIAGGGMKGFGYFKVTAVALGFYGLASLIGTHAQGTTASIFGQAPAGAVVNVSSSTGLHRHVTVGATGRYKLALPVSVYVVTLEKEGKTVDKRSNIPLTVGGGMEIDFACPNDQCATTEGG